MVDYLNEFFAIDVPDTYKIHFLWMSALLLSAIVIGLRWHKVNEYESGVFTIGFSSGAAWLVMWFWFFASPGTMVVSCLTAFVFVSVIMGSAKVRSIRHDRQFSKRRSQG